LKLLLDVGNSCLKWGAAAGGRITRGGQIDHQGTPGPEVIAALLALDIAPGEIRIASVAGPEWGQGLAEALSARFHVPLLLARSPAAGAGVRNGYRNPGQLGIDRWLALCAAYAAHPGVAACVVDAGTATTLDVVTADGLHQGGLILPGLDLMEASLRRRTGDLDRLASQRDRATRDSGVPGGGDCLGLNTGEAIRWGALRATTSLVEACMASLVAEPANQARLVLTGGHAPRLLPRLRYPAEHRPALVLEGLALEPPCFASTAG